MLSAAGRFEGLVGLDPNESVVEALAAEAEGLGGAVQAMLPQDGVSSTARQQYPDPSARGAP